MTAGIDWGAIRKRLAESEAALDAAFTLDGAQVEQLMATRARQLAVRAPVARQAAVTRSVLIVITGSERYVIELASLARIVPFRSCAPVPSGPRELRGIVNARGELWTVFDFGQLLCGSTTDGGPDGYALLLRHPKRRIGLRFDDVGNVCEVDPSQLKMVREGITDAPLDVTDGGKSASLSFVRAQALWEHPAISRGNLT
jgi:chemotaxis signal transduction protein